MAVSIRTGKKKETITLEFYYKGIRCRESFKGFKVNDTNLESAEKKLAAIEYAISMEKFVYSEFFPYSKRAAKFGKVKVKDRRFGDAIDQWLSIKETKLHQSTLINYRSKIRNHIRPAFGTCLISQITFSDIESWIAVDLIDLSNKTINEALIIMRSIFEVAEKDNVIKKSPMKHMKNLEVLPVKPDPFDKEETQKILRTPTDRDQELNMLEFNFSSGLRPSELIALGWDDIDQINWTAHVCRAKVNGKFKTTKTLKSERTVELLKPAIEALKKQLAHSYALPPIEIEVTQSDAKTVIKQDWRPVFLNSNTQKAHSSERGICARFWTTHLKNAGIRYRPFKTIRHSYASQLLSTGMISKDWIAKQMGHSSTRMIDKHYAKWIVEDAPPIVEWANDALGY